MAWHARLSASQTKQWWECAGSLAAIECFPEKRSGSGIHAQEGTCAHALVERCLETGEEPEDYRDRIIEIVKPGTDEEGPSILKANAKCPPQPHRVWFLVDDDMIDATSVMVNYVRSRLTEMGYESLGKDAAAKCLEEGVLALEKRTNPLPERDDTGGTADVTITDQLFEIEMVDYKHGKGVYVPVEGNKQLRSYLLGRVLDVFGDIDPDTLYRYTIVQPRNPDATAQSAPKYDGVLTEAIKGAELRKFQKGLEVAAARVDQARAVANDYMTDYGSTGEGVDSLLGHLFNEGYVSLGEDGSHCTFCDLKAECPAWTAKAQELAAVDFDDEPEAPAELPLADLPQIMKWIPALDKWFRSIEARAKEALFAGQEVEGYKVVRNSGKRVLKNTFTVANEDGDPEEVTLDNVMLAQRIAEEFDLDVGDIRQSAVVETMATGPQIEKLIKGKGSGERKKAFNDKYLDYQVGSLTIAPVEDRRAAVQVNPGDDFDDDLEDGE